MPDPLSLFVGLVVSTLGFAAWQIGKRRASPRAKALGVLMIVLPWLIDAPLLQAGAGAVLFALVFWP